MFTPLPPTIKRNVRFLGIALLLSCSLTLTSARICVRDGDQQAFQQSRPVWLFSVSQSVVIVGDRAVVVVVAL